MNWSSQSATEGRLGSAERSEPQPVIHHWAEEVLAHE
jgi:hypothetical protein